MKSIFYVGSNCGDDKAGLRVFDFDLESGEIRQLSQVDDAIDPIYLARSANGKFLYSAEKVVPKDGVNVGGIGVYSIEGATLTKRADYVCAPTVPCHIALSHDGKFLVYAEYRNATAGVFSVRPDGLLDGPVAKIQHKGLGLDPVRQEAAHCHCSVTTPDDSRICICDLGLDKVFVYKADFQKGTMTEVQGAGFVSVPGAGPRHIIFHPTVNLAFLVTELDSKVVSLRHLGGGVFEPVDTYAMLPDDFTGESKAAAIKISPDGQWVLASNRGYDSIAVFKLDQKSGKLERQCINKLNGVFPRDFTFTPDGKFIVLGHKLSNEVAVYAFDSVTGKMHQVANTIKMPKPLCFVFANSDFLTSGRNEMALL